MRPSVGDLDGRERLRALLAALSGAPFVLLAAGLWAGASPEVTKVTLDYSRYQKVWNNVAVLLIATAQKSSGTVLAAEEIGRGGERFGRACDPSEITGKDGAAGRVELQYDGSLADSLLSQYQFYGYYDIGAVWADVPAGRQSLASAGFGVRGQFEHGLFG